MLVGRDEELARCRAALDDAIGGQASVIEVSGEAGIGKTALVAAVTDERFRRLRASGVEDETAISYAGLEALLRPLQDRVDALPALQRNALRALLRLDDARLPDLLRVVGSVLALLAEVSAQTPLLLVVDDAHWLDDDSRRTLAAVGRRLAGERVVLLLAGREDRAPSSTAIRLRALGSAGSERLLRERRPGLADGVVDELCARSGGNPLCLVEMADALSGEQARGVTPLGARAPVPDTIRAAHQRQLAELDDDDRLLLAVLACAGSADVPTLLAASGLGERSSAVLDAVVAAGLVEVRELSVGFRHPLLRESVADHVGPAAVRHAHAALAVALAGPDHDRALWHRAAAATTHDEVLAAELANLAERLAERGRPEHARRAVERSARLTAHPGRRAERLVRATELALLTAERPDLEALLTEVRAVVSLDGELSRRVRLVEARIALRRGRRPRAAVALLDVAAELAPEQRRPIVVEAVVAAIDDDDVETARRGLDVLVADDPDPGADEGGTRFVELVRVALDHLSTSPRNAPGPALLSVLGQWSVGLPLATLTVIQRVAVDAGLLGLGRAVGGACVERAAAGGDTAAVAEAMLALAFCDHALGNWNLAAARAFEVTRMLAESFATVTAVDALLLVADVESARGRAEECHDACARVRKLAEELTDPGYAILADRREASLHLALADPAAALVGLTAAQRRFEQAGLSHPYLSPVPDLVEVLLRLGRRPEAEALASGFLPLVGDEAPEPRLARALRVRGLLAPGAEYDALLDRSAAADLSVGQTFQAARTMLCQGERRRREGRRVDARERLEEALVVFQRLEAVPWVRRVEVELAAAGAAVARPTPPALTSSLTTQELQIAALVAEGLRNNDIAGALYLSTKTVEFHLTRVYRKAGVRNRTQLAALMSHDA